MPKILIMVLSYNESPYKELMQAQQNSWDSVEVEGVETIYYYGGNERKNVHVNKWSMECGFDITDNYFLMAGKFQRCLQQIHECGNEYDFIFRSNSSSYISKQRLKEFAATLPTEKLYAGWEINGNEGFNIISGAGFFLSRDTADLLRENIDPTFEKEEDYYCAQILHEHGIKIIDNKSRIDYPQERGKDFNSAYHIRFKGPSGNRLEDAENMKKVHKIITQNG